MTLIQFKVFPLPGFCHGHSLQWASVFHCGGSSLYAHTHTHTGRRYRRKFFSNGTCFASRRGEAAAEIFFWTRPEPEPKNKMPS